MVIQIPKLNNSLLECPMSTNLIIKPWWDSRIVGFEILSLGLKL